MQTSTAASALVPNADEAIELVRKNDKLVQFKNSLKFVQASTSMSLDRMLVALDLTAASIYVDGMRAGVELAQALKEQAFPPAAKVKE